MHMEYFLKFYTAFAEDKSPTRIAEETGTQASRREPSVATISNVLRINRHEQDANAHYTESTAPSSI
jgi:hypothetical protein